MLRNATNVKMKFVTATDSDVSVGEVKPISAKMVAEKYLTLRQYMLRYPPKRRQAYISELKPHSCCAPWSKQAMARALRLPPTEKSSSQVSPN